MNIFIIGLPKSCRTTIAQAISNKLGFVYLSSSNWVKQIFRLPNTGEHELSYMEEYNKYFYNLLKTNPNLVIKSINDKIVNGMLCNNKDNFIIDGISSPRDFITLFDYNKDVVVILNIRHK